MKVIKPFFLGTLGGLALSVLLWLGLYLSPLRETVYFWADPEMADVRGKLSQYRDWLSQADLYDHLPDTGHAQKEFIRSPGVEVALRR